MCLLVVSGFMFTACDNDDLDTNQFTGGIKLNVFGPCPWLVAVSCDSSVAA